MEWIKCWSNKIDVENLKRSHEADTKTIQHGHSAKVQGANSLSIQSPDTDAFVLTPEDILSWVIEQYPLPVLMFNIRRSIWLCSIYKALRQLKADALPSLFCFRQGNTSFTRNYGL